MRQPEAEFWRATPARFNALLKRQAEGLNAAFAPFASLMAFYDSRHGHKSKPADFMPRTGAESPRDGMDVYNELLKVAKRGK